MGAGKPAVGRLVAEQLRFKFVDTDELIEKRTGRAIEQIFSRDGEPHFRALEREVVQQFAGAERLVISTGGGLPVQQENLDSLKQHALVVCLWATAERIYERVRHQKHRPLLQTADPFAKIQEMLAARASFYRQADILLNTDNRSVRQVAQQVVQQFQSITRQSQ